MSAYQSSVVGLAYEARGDYIRQNVIQGDALTLRAEPENRYDADAVAVFHRLFKRRHRFIFFIVAIFSKKAFNGKPEIRCASSGLWQLHGSGGKSETDWSANFVSERRQG